MSKRFWEDLKRVRRTVRHAILPHDRIYTEDYYAADVEQGALRSAAVMAQSIAAWAQPRSVIDIGCGTGSLLAAFRDSGCTVRGLEYSEAGLGYCRQRELPVQKFNIEKDDFDADATYDLAVSFEVAEHLPAACAERFVALLCRLAPRIAMSAARPGQGGRGHLNEQPQAYWIEKFERHGLGFDRPTSGRFAEQWQAAGASHWYYENVMVFMRRDTA